MLQSQPFSPKTPESLWNDAQGFFKKKQIQEGIQAFIEAIQLKPDYEEAYCGAIRFLIKHPDLAKPLVEEAYQKFPKSINIKLICAHFYDCIKDMPKVLQVAHEAWKLTGESFELSTQLIGSAESLCEWGLLTMLQERLMTEYNKGHFYQTREFPLFHVAWCDDPKVNQKVIAKHALDMTGHIVPLPDRRLSQKKRIRIGYLSGDWIDHATLVLMQGLFSRHDRQRFEIFVYDHSPIIPHPRRSRLKTEVEHFVHLQNMTDEEAAKKIYEDEIDILIEVKSWTQDNRTSIMAYKPGAIQVSYLALPGTTGAPYIDYCIGDPVVTPPEHDAFFTEKVIRLPECYQPNDCDRPTIETLKTREDFGFRKDQFIFCCFNQTFKIDPLMFSAWMEILKRVPNSVLWLLEPHNQQTVNNLKRFTKWIHNVDDARVIFTPRIANIDHLQRLRIVDLALDTRIYTGHTTTTDALWAGVPVLTLKGKHFASSVATSLLKSLGVEETITYSIEEFIEKAVYLSQHPDELHVIREKIAQNKKISPLFDTERYMAHFETALTTLYERYHKGEAPTALEVQALPQRTNPFTSHSPQHVDAFKKFFIYHLNPSFERLIPILGLEKFSKECFVHNQTHQEITLPYQGNPLKSGEKRQVPSVQDIFLDEGQNVRLCIEDGAYGFELNEKAQLPYLAPYDFLPKFMNYKSVDQNLSFLNGETKGGAIISFEDQALRFIVEVMLPEEKINPYDFFAKRQQDSHKKTSGIPKIVHRTWLTTKYREIPEQQMQILLLGLKVLPVGWEHYLWVNNPGYMPISMERLQKAGYKVKLFPRDVPKTSYNVFQQALSQNIGMAADIVKAAVLYEIGGIYADVDVEICEDLSPWVENFDFIGGVTKNKLVIAGFFLGSKSYHPIMEEIQNLQKRNLTTPPYYFKKHNQSKEPRIMNELATDVFPISLACAKHLGERDIILPPCFFNPEALERLTPNPQPIVMHFRTGLWGMS